VQKDEDVDDVDESGQKDKTSALARTDDYQKSGNEAMFDLSDGHRAVDKVWLFCGGTTE
jgi:hypothetical protein